MSECFFIILSRKKLKAETRKEKRLKIPSTEVIASECRDTVNVFISDTS